MAFYKCADVYPTGKNVAFDSASGSIANFNTQLAMPLSLKAYIEATQDLNGQSGPYPAGGSAQIWDEEWEVGIWNSSGQKSDSQNAIRCKNYIKINPSETYYVFANFTRYATGIILRLLDANKSFVRTVVVNSSSTKTFTADSNVEYVVWCSSSTDQITTYNNDVSINYPATDTSYHPYSNICPISGVSEIEIARTGKNLLAKPFVHFSQAPDSLSEMFFIKAGTYIVAFNNTTLANWRFAIRLKDVNGNNLSTDDYKPESGMGWREQQSLWLDGANSTRKYHVLNIVKDCYIRILFGFGATTTTTSFTDVQLELGSTATDYEPYNGNEYIINLGGTYYGGHLTQDKAGHRKFEVTHDITDLGDAVWNYAVWGAGYVFSTNLLTAKDQAVSVVKGDIICSIYNNVSASELYNSNPNYSMCLNRTNVRIANSDYSNRDTFKAAMSGIMLVYPLATPIIIDLPDGDPINSLPGLNNIFNDSGDTEVNYTKLNF